LARLFGTAEAAPFPKPWLSSGLPAVRKIFAVYHLPAKCIYTIIQALRALAELINLESHEGDYA